jgi:hypothetical protein
MMKNTSRLSIGVLLLLLLTTRSSSFLAPTSSRSHSLSSQRDIISRSNIFIRPQQTFHQKRTKTTTTTRTTLLLGLQLESEPSASPPEKPTKFSIMSPNRGLFIAYLAVGSWIEWNIRQSRLALSSAQLILSMLWLGFVLAISGMEAWLKFRAPFCPQPFALDIGRTIFPALNSVEMALASSLWIVRFDKLPLSLWLIGPTAVLGVNVLFLTPKLVRRGKQVVYQHIKTHGGAKLGTDSAEFEALEKELEGEAMLAKTDKWHVVYIVLESLKIIGLSLFASNYV